MRALASCAFAMPFLSLVGEIRRDGRQCLVADCVALLSGIVDAACEHIATAMRRLMAEIFSSLCGHWEVVVVKIEHLAHLTVSTGRARLTRGSITGGVGEESALRVGK